MHTNFRRRLQLFGFAALCLLFGVRGTWAQDNQDDTGVDPPDRVARLSYTQGTVSLEPAGAEDWTDAAVNRPMTSGDKLWVDARSRAELQVGSATIFLDQNTAFSFSELNDEAMQMRITGGAINIRVRRLNEHETVEVDTPNAAIGLTQPGEYHVAINDAGDATVIKVRSGQTSIANGEENFLVSANQQATLTGTDRLAVDTAPLGPSSSFEDWAHDRVRQGEQSQSARYVSPEVVGYQDLDEYGSWSSEPEYGEVWVPSRVDVDWAPYRFGRWMWVAPWGWTWVDNAPWGFAPFHYGRWAHVRDRWCWVPGPIHARPVYAPALVAWVGGRNASVSVSIGGPGIGWFPLAPREVYVPGYRVSPRYMHNVNVSNTTIVNNTYITNVYENRAGNINYANRNAPHAVTVVQRDAFTRGQPVAQHLERVDERQLRTFQGRDAVPRIAPTRESVLGDRGARGPRCGARLRRSMSGPAWRDINLRRRARACRIHVAYRKIMQQAPVFAIRNPQHRNALRSNAVPTTINPERTRGSKITCCEFPIELHHRKTIQRLSPRDLTQLNVRPSIASSNGATDRLSTKPLLRLNYYDGKCPVSVRLPPRRLLCRRRCIRRLRSPRHP